MPSTSASASSSSSRGATRRLIKELDTWRSESRDEKGIERLGPVSEDDLLAWEAVINGRGVGGGYDGALAFLLACFTSQLSIIPPFLPSSLPILAPTFPSPGPAPPRACDLHDPRARDLLGVILLS